jgi:hypothetical protein
VLAVAEPHDLDVPPRRLGAAPVGAHLFVDFELFATEPGQNLAELAHQSLVLGTAVFRDDVAVGLKQHPDGSPSPGNR